LKTRNLLFTSLASSIVLLTQSACGPVSEGEQRESSLPQMPLGQIPNELDSMPVQAMGPAPALSYLQAVAVISSQYPNDYEYLDVYAYSTTHDHGGAELYIVTEERGYGQNRIAMMNGTRLTEYTDQTHPQRIVDSSGTIVGWYRWWIAHGQQSGTFSYESTSINYPYNTMYDRLYVR